MTWLFVEDEPDIWEMLLAFCELSGIEGMIFEDAESVLAWIDSVDSGQYKGALPEAAILDRYLGSTITGAMIGARLRQSPVLGNIAIILTSTGKHTPEQDAEYKAMAQTPHLLYLPLPKWHDFMQYIRDAVRDRPTERTNGYPRASLG